MQDYVCSFHSTSSSPLHPGKYPLVLFLIIIYLIIPFLFLLPFPIYLNPIIMLRQLRIINGLKLCNKRFRHWNQITLGMYFIYPLVNHPLVVNGFSKSRYNVDGSVERFKARLIGQGFTQQEGIDYHDTFSPIAKKVIVLTVISLVAHHGWPLCQMDVYNKSTCLLHPVFALRGRLGKHDYSLFTKEVEDQIVIMLIYVDDLLIIEYDGKFIDELKQVLHQSFKMKDLGNLKYFLGIKIFWSENGVVLNQRKYALELILDMGLTGGKVVVTPLEQNQKLISIEYDETI
ncbi:protein detoxification 35 [Gossypium australe]|uniref:Protein detoxification 35 n=1 Tax=Gossypium australe TaxID=47621 RepID=A0A5B6UVI8_9ROSI|nr:protein detoxification 35 [Gossypium australe]